LAVSNQSRPLASRGNTATTNNGKPVRRFPINRVP